MNIIGPYIKYTNAAGYTSYGRKNHDNLYQSACIDQPDYTINKYYIRCFNTRFNKYNIIQDFYTDFTLTKLTLDTVFFYDHIIIDDPIEWDKLKLLL